MKLKTRSSIFSSTLQYLLPALVFTLSMQLLRVFISGLAWYLRDTVGISTISLIPYAFGTFLLGFLAAALRRLAGSRNALWITAGGVAILRLVEQLSANPALDFGLSIIGVGLFLNFLSIFIGHLRMQGDRAAPRWIYGLVLGLAFDIALRGVFGARDLNAVSGVVPLVVVVVIVVLIFWALWREPKPDADIASDAAWKHALPLMTIGPYMVLQLLFFQSQGWVEEVAGLNAPLGFVIVMLGSLSATAGIAWGFARPRSMHPILAFGIAIYLALVVYYADQAGGMIVFAILIGQLLMGWGWAVVASVAKRADRPGLWRTTVAVAGGMVLFLALVFAYYLAMDIAMPFPRQVFPTAAAALLGLLLLFASIQTRSQTEVASWDLSGISVAGVLAIVPLAYWVLLGSAPTPEQPSGLPIKVMSYNVHSGFSFSGRQDLEAIAHVIEDSGADIVALQEVSRVRLMDGSADMSTWLSQRLDMPILFRGTEEPIWGNAILSRYPVLESGWGELPLAGTLIKRGYLWARIDVGGPQPLLVIVTHLHHHGPDSLARQAQVPVILRFWNGQGYSLLLGDLNAEPDSTEMKLIADVGLLDSWSDAGVGPGFTFSSGDPYQRIDWIWHTEDLVAVEVQVLQTQASDHLPVVAILDIAP
ncbi:MAG: endonuclease/exonuclease/phosphatase family protein [Chloroflexi bacterium]|nr:endonuclease/exonuclease/phosphatase family protein [Chloroflexota bacterium]